MPAFRNILARLLALAGLSTDTPTLSDGEFALLATAMTPASRIDLPREQ